jgi:hypothetical protein
MTHQENTEIENTHAGEETAVNKIPYKKLIVPFVGMLAYWILAI